MAATVTTSSGAKWQDVAQDRQRHRDSTISTQNLPALPGSLPLDATSIPATVLTPSELAIVGLSVEALLGRLSSGELSAVSVTSAFLRSAALAQRLANCVTELLPERALERARWLDAFRAEHGGAIAGRLHGLPISVKEHIGMKGLDLNAGFVSWVGSVADEDAHILKILWDAGAVFYVRTTQPQTLMHLETSSALYGVTVNPHNRTLTSGGSSGGEGALVGLRGSILGIGTDIGGSIRSPAAACGVFGFKPTSGRLPFDGLAYTMHGAESIPAAVGPISTSLEGCRIFVQALLDAKPWLREPALVPLPWTGFIGEWQTQGPSFRPLRVAVMWNDGVVGVHPPIDRALRRVVQALEKSDRVEVVEWKPYRHDLAWKIIAGLYFADGGAEESRAIAASGEPWMALSRFIIEENPFVVHHTMASLWAANNERDAYRDAYNALWTTPSGHPVADVILCPVGPSVAPRLDTARYWAYTATWNLLDYPAVVFPVGEHVDPADYEGEEDGRYRPTGSGSDAEEYQRMLWEGPDGGAEAYRGAPVALQLVARRFEDERLLESLWTVMTEAGLPVRVPSPWEKKK